MATLTVNELTAAGLRIDNKLAAVAAGGDRFTNDGLTVLWFKNSHSSNAYTVTATVQKTVVNKSGYGDATKSNSISVTGTGGARAEVWAGTFPRIAYNNVNGQTLLTYSGSAPATDLKVAVFKLYNGGVGD